MFNLIEFNVSYFYSSPIRFEELLEAFNEAYDPVVESSQRPAKRARKSKGKGKAKAM